MTMPDFPVSPLLALYDPVEFIVGKLRDELVALGLVPSGEHVIYGPGRSDENEPLPPRVTVDIEDDFTVDSPQAGRTNYGYGMMNEREGQNSQGPVPYELVAPSVATIRETMRFTLWARVPEDGEADPIDLSGDVQSKINRRAVMELRSRTVSIVCELLGSSRAGEIQGRMLKAEEGTGQSGAGCEFSVPFYTEVPSTAGLVRVTPTTAQEFEVTAAFPEGDKVMAIVTVN